VSETNNVQFDQREIEMEPEAIIEVRFKTTNEGGRKNGVGAPLGQKSVVDWYGCAFVVDGDFHDCRLLLEGRFLDLGTTYEVPVTFLRPDLVLPKLPVGKEFLLCEGARELARGKVISLLR
jgi:hypothetical protein